MTNGPHMKSGFPWDADRAGRMAYRALLFLVLLFCLASFISSLTGDWKNGGSDFRQGDWLIHMHGGPVRRGVVGEVFLWLSDVTAVSPVAVVIATQAVLGLALLVVMARVLWRLPQDAMSALLFLSPAFSLVFWCAEHEATFRKEILGALALFCALGALQKQKLWLYHLSGALMVLSVWAHEAMAFLLPVFMAISWAVLRSREDIGRPTRPVLITTGIVLLLGGAGFCFALVFRNVDNVAQLCEPLLQRDVPETFCAGAISWAAAEMKDHLALLHTARSERNMLYFGLGAVLWSLPYAFFVADVRPVRRGLFLILCGVVPILPLYFVAIDWGRWLSLQAFCLTVLFIAATHVGWLRRNSGGRWIVTLLCLIIALRWHPDYLTGLP
ncbi:hypothetical protein C8N42_10682 [Celeribacter persicus]|uniref:Uncharacterized protein n=2 Tax=Celeribacter persicus TaxID=1651082 RepID=A0A2T5HLW7_9RHOB|nr:hypothetical protein C8N42_10682 [Celeribacter persicus]